MEKEEISMENKKQHFWVRVLRHWGLAVLSWSYIVLKKASFPELSLHVLSGSNLLINLRIWEAYIVFFWSCESNHWWQLQSEVKVCWRNADARSSCTQEQLLRTGTERVIMVPATQSPLGVMERTVFELC